MNELLGRKVFIIFFCMSQANQDSVMSLRPLSDSLLSALGFFNAIYP